MPASGPPGSAVLGSPDSVDEHLKSLWREHRNPRTPDLNVWCRPADSSDVAARHRLSRYAFERQLCADARARGLSRS